jgi:hypothetical protein
MMRRVFSTVAGRFFTVLAIAFIFGVNIYALNERIIHPSEWYYYTTDGAGIDIRQPGGRQIVAQDVQPTGLTSETSYREWREHCDFEQPRKSSTIGAEWRGVTLCNAGDHSGDEFDRRHAYFKTAVDEEYARYYWNLTERHTVATLWALVAWVVVICLYFTAHWVLRPASEHEQGR